jgi:hypothetical protein
MRAGAVVTLLAPLLLVGASDAQAADRLKRRDLPGVAVMATVYPELTGGQRDVIRTDTFDANAGNDCVAIRTLGTPRRALWASYYTADGEDPYFQGGESATPFVHRFRNLRDARVLMSRLGNYFERCAGPHRSDDGTRTRLTERPVTELADRTLAYQVRFRHPIGSGTPALRNELHVVVRDGRTVVNVMLQAEKFLPDLDHAVAVAQLTLEAAS